MFADSNKSLIEHLAATMTADSVADSMARAMRRGQLDKLPLWRAVAALVAKRDAFDKVVR